MKAANFLKILFCLVAVLRVGSIDVIKIFRPWIIAILKLSQNSKRKICKSLDLFETHDCCLK
jgi:hypothetical protein